MHLKNLYKKSFTLILLRGISLLLTLSISFFIANQYGAKVTGIYYLFISILTGLSITAKFGLDNSLVKYVSQLCNNKQLHYIRGLWYQAIKISLLICTLILVISTLTIFLYKGIQQSNFNTILYAMLSLIPFTLFGINIALIRGLNRLLTASFFESLIFPTAFLLIMVILHLSNISNNILKGYLLSSLALMLITLIYIYKALYNNQEAHLENKKRLTQTSIPILGINLLNFISNWGATFILAAYSSLEAIGIYNISWRIIAITSVLTLVFNNINAPIYSKKYESGSISEIDQLSRNTSIALTTIGLPTMIIIMFFADYILGLFGDTFVTGTLILQVLAAGQLISFMTGSVGYLLLMTGNEKKLRSIALYVSTIQIILYLIFVPIFDITAAAIITSAAIASRNLLATYTAYKYIGIISLPIPLSLKKKYI